MRFPALTVIVRLEPAVHEARPVWDLVAVVPVWAVAVAAVEGVDSLTVDSVAKDGLNKEA